MSRSCSGCVSPKYWRAPVELKFVKEQKGRRIPTRQQILVFESVWLKALVWWHQFTKRAKGDAGHDNLVLETASKMEVFHPMWIKGRNKAKKAWTGCRSQNSLGLRVSGDSWSLSLEVLCGLSIYTRGLRYPLLEHWHRQSESPILGRHFQPISNMVSSPEGLVVTWAGLLTALIIQVHILPILSCTVSFCVVVINVQYLYN